MKKITLFFVLFTLVYVMNAQDYAVLRYGSTDSETLSVGDMVYVPVIVDEFTSDLVNDFMSSIEFDDSVLNYDSITDLHPNMSNPVDWIINYNGNVVGFFWADPAFCGVPVNAGDTLCTLVFVYNGGETELSFGEGSAINTFESLLNYTVDGCVCANPTLPAIFHISFNSNLIKGADISIAGESILTDSLGVAIFDLSPSTYDYTIFKEGFLPESGSITMSDDAEIIIVNLTIALSQYEFITGPKQWSTINYSNCGFPVIQCLGTKVYRFGIYEVINSNVYFEIFESMDEFQTDWVLIGYLREDVENHQLIYRNLEGAEGLIYDFEMEVGDVITIDNVYLGGYGIEMECVGMETIIMNGEEKIQYELHNNDYDQSEIWIEGMGSKNGFLSSGFYGTGIVGGGPELLCCSFYDELLYSNPIFPDCFYDTFYPKFSSSSSDTAYKNVYYEYQLDVNDYNVESYTWSALDIPEGLSFDPSTGILSGTPSEAGSYQIDFLVTNNDIGFTTDQLFFSLLIELDDGISKNTGNQLRIYPNLFSDIIQIKVDKQEDYHLYIYNGLGIEIDTRLFNGSFNLNCSQYLKGIYFFKIVDENNQIVLIQKMIRK